MSWLEKCDGPEDPMSYLRGLVNRAAATQTWLEKSEQGRLLHETLDLSELFHPDTFLNALRQQTARYSTLNFFRLDESDVGLHSNEEECKVQRNTDVR